VSNNVGAVLLGDEEVGDSVVGGEGGTCGAGNGFPVPVPVPLTSWRRRRRRRRRRRTMMAS